MHNMYRMRAFFCNLLCVHSFVTRHFETICIKRSQDISAVLLVKFTQHFQWAKFSYHMPPKIWIQLISNNSVSKCIENLRIESIWVLSNLLQDATLSLFFFLPYSDDILLASYLKKSQNSNLSSFERHQIKRINPKSNLIVQHNHAWPFQGAWWSSLKKLVINFSNFWYTKMSETNTVQIKAWATGS